MCGRAVHSANGLASALGELGQTSSKTYENSSSRSNERLGLAVNRSLGIKDYDHTATESSKCGSFAVSCKSAHGANSNITAKQESAESAEINNIATIQWLEKSFNTIENPNMSPGHGGVVIRRDTCTENHAGDAPRGNDREAHNLHDRKSDATVENSSARIECAEMIWGFVPKRGTTSAPLPERDASRHYAMFNARSETLYDRHSFRGPILSGQTCIFPVDGFYEWKKPSPNTLGSKKKQPYLVRRSDRKPMLLAGLWTSVKTGRKRNRSAVCDALGSNLKVGVAINNNGTDDEDEVLSTFTLLTADATPGIQWLHDRQPVILTEKHLALDWLFQPSRKILQKILTENGKEHPEFMSTHPVTQKMSDSKYRGNDCTAEVKYLKLPSVKSFFGSSIEARKADQKIRTGQETIRANKRSLSQVSSSLTDLEGEGVNTSPSKINAKNETHRRPSPPPAKKKRGAITSYFTSTRKAT